MPLSKFNKNQRSAITLSCDVNKVSNILIIAGAGSGKTTVLTERIRFLIEHNNAQNEVIPPESVLALTFTRKAADEMKERLTNLTPQAKGVTIGTFHSVSANLLRKYCPVKFDIIDTNDQKSIVRFIINTYSETFKNEISVKDFLDKLSALRSKNYSPLLDNNKDFVFIVKKYQQQKNTMRVFDFDDLIEKAVLLIKNNPRLKSTLHRQWKYLLIDEYQDTNSKQFEFISLLRGKDTQLLQVGDEDQLIYSWRGAEIKHIIDSWKKSQQDRATVCITLDINYRCSSNILLLANKIVSVNENRTDKIIKPHHEKLEAVEVNTYDNDFSEAEDIAQQIIKWHSQGVFFGDMSILLRINRMSRGIERELIKAKIPYKLYNAIELFNRKEIRLILSLLMFMEKPDVFHYLQEILSVIKVGVSAKTLFTYDKERIQLNMNWIEYIVKHPKLMKKSKLLRLILAVEEVNQCSKDNGLVSVVEYWVNKFFILDAFKASEQDSRKDNVDMLTSILRDYELNAFNKDVAPTVSDFQEQRLLNDVLVDGDATGKIHVMSIHKAKGLEFSHGFVVGVQDGVFPMIINEENSDKEEDVRLAYVAFTRFMKKLIITRSEYRVGFKSIETYSTIIDPHKRSLELKGAIKYVRK